jgi:hypothetical protein
MAGLRRRGVDVAAPAGSMAIDWEREHAAIWRLRGLPTRDTL